MKNDEVGSFYTEEYIVYKLLEGYFDKIGVKPIETDIMQNDIKHNEIFLKRHRIDTNLPDDMKDNLKGLSQILFEKKIVDRKLSYYDMVVMMYKKYLESYPEIKQSLLEYQYIKQQLGLKELQDKHEKEKYGV